VLGTHYTFWIGIAVALVVLGGGVWLYLHAPSVTDTMSGAGAPPAETETHSREEKGKTDTSPSRFSHPRYPFSFALPETFGITRHPEGNASETIIFQGQEDAKRSFQIFVTPYAENVITQERLDTDVRGTIADPQEGLIGEGVRALAFWSEHPELGRMREVWLIHDGFLYEVTTYAALDTWLAKVLDSWRFHTAR